MNKEYKLYFEILTRAHAGINLWLDSDAYSTVKELYKFLNHGDLYGRIKYIPMTGDYDPSLVYQEFGKKGIIDCLRSARKLPFKDSL